MLLGNSGNFMTGGVNRVASVFFVPLAEVCSLVHVLDDLPPTHARVIGAEGDLAFLSAVGNHAHLGAAKVVVEKILKPHTFNAEHAPDIARIFLRAGSLHTIVAVGA